MENDDSEEKTGSPYENRVLLDVDRLLRELKIAERVFVPPPPGHYGHLQFTRVSPKRLCKMQRVSNSHFWEVDVGVYADIFGTPYFLAIECKFRSSSPSKNGKIGMPQLDEFYGKLCDIGWPAAPGIVPILITTLGFQKGVIESARSRNIWLASWGDPSGSALLQEDVRASMGSTSYFTGTLYGPRDETALYSIQDFFAVLVRDVRDQGEEACTKASAEGRQFALHDWLPVPYRKPV